MYQKDAGCDDAVDRNRHKPPLGAPKRFLLIAASDICQLTKFDTILLRLYNLLGLTKPPRISRICYDCRSCPLGATGCWRSEKARAIRKLAQPACLCAHFAFPYFLRSAEMPHNHNHVPGSGCCEHEHIEMGGGSGGAGGGAAPSGGEPLLPYIDTVNVRCLNERVDKSCRLVFKGLADKADKSTYMDSGEFDPEMLLHIPFTSTVKLRSLCVSGGEHGRTPATIRLFANKPDLDFSAAQDAAPLQEVLLSHEDPSAETWHPLKTAKFNNISSLQLHFTGALSGDDEGDVRIYFLGLKGESTGFKHGLPTEVVYEARPQLSDHQAREDQRLGRALGL